MAAINLPLCDTPATSAGPFIVPCQLGRLPIASFMFTINPQNFENNPLKPGDFQIIYFFINAGECS